MMDCIATTVPYADRIAAFANSDFTQDVPSPAGPSHYMTVHRSGAQVKAWEIQERDKLSVTQLLDLSESMATAPDHEIESDVSAFAVASAPVVEAADESEHSYQHIHLKPAFSVQATYQHVGKLKPRKFSLDE